MDISDRGIELIVSFEGKHTKLPDGRYAAYLDRLASPAVPTIYCGLTKGVRMGMICTEAEGERMFRKELAIYEDAVERLVKVPLNQNQFDALVSFVYNCGVGALQGSTLLRLLNAGHYPQVPAQLMRWVNAGGKRYEGLARRRAAEGALFMEPMPLEPSEPAIINGQVIEAPEPVVPPMPQRPEQTPVVPVTQAVTESWTIRGAALAALGTVTSAMQQGYELAFGVAKEAGPEIVSLKTALTPFDPLLKLTPFVLTGIILTGIAIVVSRRINAAREGKVG